MLAVVDNCGLMDGAVVLVLLMPGAIIQLASTAFAACGSFLRCLRFCNTRHVSIILYAEQERKKDKSSSDWLTFSYLGSGDSSVGRALDL